jgi:hypothetical protein
LVPPAPTPSARLVRAAAAERADLRRHRERLLGARDRLRAELETIEAALRDLDDRDALLERLAGPPAAAEVNAGGPRGGDGATSGGPPGEASAFARERPGSAAASGDERRGPGSPSGGERPGVAAASADERSSLGSESGGRRPGVAPGAAADPPARAVPLLRGPAIRRAAVQVLRALPDRPQALHYRAWFEAVRAAGFEVAGKDPLAVFLTQLSRSPVVRRGTQSGVYELDPTAPRRLRERLDALHAELRGLTATPSATADLTAIRARRAAITTQITRVEKALEEAESTLDGGGGPAARVAATG